MDKRITVFMLLIVCAIVFFSVPAASGFVTLAKRHTLRITASANPAPISSGGTTQLDANATDNKGHTATFKWSDNGAGGTFTPGTDVKNPSWTGPGNTTAEAVERNLKVTATCSDKRPLKVSVTLKVPEKPKKN